MIILFLSLFSPLYQASSIGMGLLPPCKDGFAITGVRYYGLSDLQAIVLDGKFYLPFRVSYLGPSWYSEFAIRPSITFTFEDITTGITPGFLFSRSENRIEYGITFDLFFKFEYACFRGGGFFRNAMGWFPGGELVPEEEVFLFYNRSLITTGGRIRFSNDGVLEYGFGASLDLKPITFRLGFRTTPFVPGFGFGFDTGMIIVDMGFESHPVLGFTESITIRRK